MPETKNMIKILNEGGIGILPTDTIYGIVGSAFSKKAVERIYKIKGRDKDKPFIVLISAIAEIEKFGINVKHPVFDKKLLQSFWPGPVSIIFPCNLKKFEYLHRGKKSIAFRFPAKRFLIDIIKKTGPLVAPSANPSGLTSAENIKQAKTYFEDRVDFYMPGGIKKGKPSKVVSFVSGFPVVLRK